MASRALVGGLGPIGVQFAPDAFGLQLGVPTNRLWPLLGYSSLLFGAT